MKLARALLLGFTLFACFGGGCAQTVNQYRVVDVASRREYTALGQPNFLLGGAINFHDRDSGRMVTVQSYEVYGLEGESFQVQYNPWTGRQELVKSQAAERKPAGY